ncbi:tyrosine-type recombinase/integrase [Pandoraea apista]|uniref:Site-specific integrase n=1 Tax=Pandoraea apista TaxID=93218 RepID=A0ABX9ZHQ9_9BURK|nr:site-specific integrase [Pandoraea apista]PTE02672.1 integrase [Pandoraea apista]RRJ27541.1 site-specific integrase [Pandoraea apista]RRJ73168.1 site-specific integrase [Pandoraea apista]RSD06479.1 site-specific integrase [Pandoraea apista]RSD11278.1 site-specific integrase [Pandoraea apista]
MASRQLNRLTAIGISKEVRPGYYADGGGLYLQISASGSRSWIFKFTIGGRTREMGLGPLSTVSLAAARKTAAECRGQVKNRIDPIVARSTLSVHVAASAKHRPFRDAADEFIRDRRGTWKNAKHAQQWTNTLVTYAYPIIGDMDVRDVDTSAILRILQPIWTKKPETAQRVRGRIKAVLDAESVRGNRAPDNPARFTDHLDRVLPRTNKRQQVKHHPALPWEDIPAFVRELETRPRRAARALHLLILTAVRTNEVRFARTHEFDMAAKVWEIPGERMKCGVTLRVPLSDRAFALVKDAMAKVKPGGYLFPGIKEGQPLSNMSMLKVLKMMERSDITVHGFRSTFRDWVADCTDYPDSLAEQALAHTISSSTVAAYRRRDMLDRRRPMMEDWAAYCAGETAQILPFTRAQPAA